MFKKVISLCITAIILSSSFSNIVFAENEADHVVPQDGLIELIDENGNVVENKNPVP